MGNFEAAIMKTDSFLKKNLEKKLSKIWNEIGADAVRNLNENYTNRKLKL